MRKKIMVNLLGVGILFLVGCNAGKDQTNIEVIQNMMDQTNIKAQDWDKENPEQPTMRVPPEGSVPRGYFPMKESLKFDAEAAGQQIKNPNAGDYSAEILSLGKETYDIYCTVCHGATGKGDGSVAEKMAIRPPTLLSSKVNAYTDGRLYHVITRGQGVMGAYGGQIQSESDRWAVVNYVRTLQRKGQ